MRYDFHAIILPESSIIAPIASIFLSGNHPTHPFIKEQKSTNNFFFKNLIIGSKKTPRATHYKCKKQAVTISCKKNVLETAVSRVMHYRKQLTEIAGTAEGEVEKPQ